MLPNTIRAPSRGRRGFTLAEVLIAAMIGTMVIASAWAVYMMVWQWFAEMSPRLDVERSARMALLRIVEGVPGSVTGDTGKITVNNVDYKRRNGIAWSTDLPDLESVTLDGTTKVRRINFRLRFDDEKAVVTGNVRSFYVEKSGDRRIISYRYYDYDDNQYKTRQVANTKDVTYDVEFGNFTDDGTPPTTYQNIMTVKVTAEREVYGTRLSQPYTVKVEYTDTVYLRNKLD